jgi:hypothetical protein
MSESDSLEIPAAVRADFEPILKALGPARAALANVPEVIVVRPGYDYSRAGAPVPAIVVAVKPGAEAPDGARLAGELGVPVSVTDASVDEQIAALQREEKPVAFGEPAAGIISPLETLLTGEEPLEFAPPKTGAYEPLDPPQLPLVDEKMKVTVCVSPEAGWTELEGFLAGTNDRLTVAMYQFTAPHIFKAVHDAVAPEGRELELVLHPIPEKPAKSGVKAHDLDEVKKVVSPLEKEIGDRFKMSWATLASKAHPDGQWASAYHIKVAVRDGKAFWLSSGNWQSSNQPDVHPFADPPSPVPPGFQRKYNRDYHAIIENKALAAAYETYIKRDYELTSAEGAAESFALPDLFVSEEEEEAVEFAEPPRFFQPLRLDRRLKVQPLLTPDNYAEHALKLIQSAKKTVWFQNQYINFRNTGEDFPIFKRLITALKKQVDKGLDVRVICRDMMKQESVDVLIALGFPRKLMRFQPACHNKTIIVDGKVVMFGSHNWSNEGVATNRDASLIFYDEEIAKYLAEVYEYDWERLATAKPTPPRIRVARPGEKTPHGFERMAFSAVFED